MACFSGSSHLLSQIGHDLGHRLSVNVVLQAKKSNLAGNQEGNIPCSMQEAWQKQPERNQQDKHGVMGFEMHSSYCRVV